MGAVSERSQVQATAHSRLRILRRAVEERLAATAPGAERVDPLNAAMRSALLAPGKRVRPLLVLLACRELGRDGTAALDAACAVEMIHTASLILDDLPSMDDAELRRGQPATHVAYGEDVAILAAVALLGRAFATVATSPALDAAARGRIVAILGDLVGPDGLAGGQFADLHGSAAAGALDRIVDTNHLKTGVLFLACVDIGIVVAGETGVAAERLRSAAAHLGQAFQLCDDLKDGAAAEDAGKPTLLALMGHGEARSRMDRHVDAALELLQPGGSFASFVEALFGRSGGSAARPLRVEA